MKYQLKKQSGLALNKNHQYNILGFDLILLSDPNVSGISEPGFYKRYVYVFLFLCVLFFFVLFVLFCFFVFFNDIDSS